MSGSLRARLKSGVAWNLLATLFNQGSFVAVGLVISNILGKDVFGDFTILLSTLVAISSITLFLCGMTATKYVAEFRSTDRRKTGEILGLNSTIAAVVALLALVVLLGGGDWLAERFLDAPQLGFQIKLLSVVVCFSAMTGFQTGALAGLEAFESTARVSVISGAALIAAIAVASKLWGLNAALIAWMLVAAGKWVLFQIVLRIECSRQGIKIRYRGMGKQWGVVHRFALPNAALGVTAALALWWTNAQLFKQYGNPGMASFGAAFNLRQIVLLLPAILNSVTFSLFNNQRGLKDADRYRKVFWWNFMLNGLAVVVFAGAAALFGKALLSMFGKDFKGDSMILTIMMLSAVPIAISNAVNQVLLSEEKLWLSFFAVSLPRDLTLLAGTYLLVPKLGAMGLAWAHVAGYSLLLVLVSIVAWRVGLSGAFAQTGDKLKK